MQGDLSAVQKPEQFEQAIAIKLHKHFAESSEVASEMTDMGSITDVSRFATVIQSQDHA